MVSAFVIRWGGAQSATRRVSGVEADVQTEGGGRVAFVTDTAATDIHPLTARHTTGLRHMCIKRPAAWEQSSPIRSRLLYYGTQAAIGRAGGTCA